MINKYSSYAVFGLGRYGLAVAKELVKSDAEVLAIDIDEEKVKNASTELPICKCADITDPEVIEKLGIANIDVVIISMANNFEETVMALTLCKEVGVKTVIVKCASEMHQKILKRMGANKVVFPEKESGIQLAKNLLRSGFADLVDISDDISMIELDVISEWVNKSITELNLRKKYGINIIAICKDESVITDIEPTTTLKKDMKLIVIADNRRIKKLNRDYNNFI